MLLQTEKSLFVTRIEDRSSSTHMTDPNTIHKFTDRQCGIVATSRLKFGRNASQISEGLKMLAMCQIFQVPLQITEIIVKVNESQ